MNADVHGRRIHRRRKRKRATATGERERIVSEAVPVTSDAKLPLIGQRTARCGHAEWRRAAGAQRRWTGVRRNLRQSTWSRKCNDPGFIQPVMVAIPRDV